MNLLDIVRRDPRPEPWAEGDNIPWHEPAFSARMLREHLSQAHDAASRRLPKVDAHVAWIQSHVLGGQPTRILDLGCGPGLYSSRLAQMGHSCLGIDYSPASVAYARETAAREGLDCTYRLEDMRAADYGRGFGLAMLLYGELNVFRPEDAREILSKAWQALIPGGQLLLEPSTEQGLRRAEPGGRRWFTSESGLFGERPYLRLQETLWSTDGQTVTVRHYVIDAASGEVTRYAQTLQAYAEGAYRELLESCGFGDIICYPSLLGKDDPEQPDFVALVARKPQD